MKTGAFITIILILLAYAFPPVNNKSIETEDWIVFVGEVWSDTSNAVRVNPVTMEYKFLTYVEEFYSKSAWPVGCPSGASDQIAFGGGDGLILTNGDSHEQILPAYNHTIQGIDWSPDDKKLVLSDSVDDLWMDIFVLNIVTGVLTPISQSETLAGIPSWSPNGQDIVYAYVINGLYGINIVQSDGSNERILLQSSHYISSPQWSPDGDWITFDWSDGEFSNVYRMRSNGTEITQLTYGTEYHSLSPSYSPDGNFISFSSNQSGKYEIYIMSISGANVEKINLLDVLMTHGDLFNMCWMRVPVSFP